MKRFAIFAGITIGITIAMWAYWNRAELRDQNPRALDDPGALG